MSKKKETNEQASKLEVASDNTDKMVQDLIKDLNREHQTRVAWNLGTDLSPTHVKRWVSTGCLQLDYAVSNCRDGGLPEGRIIEIYGPPSIGKSHIAAQICRSCQKLGGIAVYIDTENAVNPENLTVLGVDVTKRFIYVETGCVEDTFQVMESIITKVKASNKDVPVVIIWDSVAATPAKAELEADYDKDSIGLQARQLSKGFRKVTQLIGNQNVTLVCLNQIRTKIGVMYGDPMCVDPYTTKVKVRKRRTSS
jgi:recombination protein RecA